MPAVFALILLACSSAPEAPPAAPAPAIDDAAVAARWKPFFADRFGSGAAEVHVGEVAGRGACALVVLENGTTLVFPDPTVDVPTEWDVLDVGPQHAVHVVRDGIRIGERTPLVVRWDAAEEAWAFSQAVPAGLEAATERAKGEHPTAFAAGPKWWLGEKGFDGEPDLAQHFYGDFDHDGKPDLAVLVPGSLVLYRASGDPMTTPIDYPARRAMVHFAETGKHAFHPFPGDDAEHPPAPIEIDRDWLDLVVPEASSQSRYFAEGAWKTVWLGD
ncbi:MAG: VCBS repeat-containing protein [Alphaproteobacteria bacterium]|nr:VCBS repeat-containing protein [Alphaproteobacteria bacterium]